MNDEIKEILENIKCPQLGYDEYGKWGALPLNVRMTLKRLCDYVVSCDDYITNLQQENERLKHQLNQEKPNYLQIWQLEDRIDKAIEYIKFEWAEIVEDECYENHLWSVDGLVIKKILNILQNGGDD